MTSWTDSRDKSVEAKGVSGEKHCRIVTLDVPSSVRVNEYADIKFECHIDKGTDVKGCLGILNKKGNPGDMIVYIDGREFKVPPDYMIQGCLKEGRDSCTRYVFGNTVRIKFTKTGKYVLRFLAGYL